MIPKIMWQAWFGPREQPDWLSGCLDSVRQHHQGWDYRMIRGDTEAFQHLTSAGRKAWRLVPQVYEELNVPRIRSAILRVELLWQHGGVWIDADTQCVQPFDPIVDVGMSAFCVWDHDDPKGVINTPIGATERHPFIGRLRDTYPMLRGGDLDRHRFVMTDIKRLIGPDVTVFESGVLSPSSWQAVEDGEYPEFEGTYAVHHWQYARQLAGFHDV